MANGDGQDPGAFGPDAGRKVHIHEPGRGGVGATVGAVAGGDLVVLNKIDLVDAETLAQVHEWIDSIRPGVQVFETTRCRLPMEILLGTGAADPKRVAPGAELGVHVQQVSAATESQSHDRDHDHRLLFDTWTFSTDVPIQMGLLQQML